jgi:hypothetical protein
VDRLVPTAVEALNEIMQLTPVNNLAGYDPAVENEGRPGRGTPPGERGTAALADLRPALDGRLAWSDGAAKNQPRHGPHCRIHPTDLANLRACGANAFVPDLSGVGDRRCPTDVATSWRKAGGLSRACPANLHRRPALIANTWTTARTSRRSECAGQRTFPLVDGSRSKSC